MRIALLGAGDLAVDTARLLIDLNHDVVLVDQDRDRLELLSDDLDIGFIHGDGSRPAILKEVDPQETDVLFCLTDNDQNNILAALVGRSLGFARVIPEIHNREYETICNELGLSETIIPDYTIARTLADSVEGRDLMELSTMIRGSVRFYSFPVKEDEAGPITRLDLPAQTRPICVYHDGDHYLPDDGSRLEEGDAVMLITDARAIDQLRERWG